VDKKERSEALQKEYNADVAEMEAFAVATVAREY
jgi:nucleoside phosphorylase